MFGGEIEKDTVMQVKMDVDPRSMPYESAIAHHENKDKPSTGDVSASKTHKEKLAQCVELVQEQIESAVIAHTSAIHVVVSHYH